MASRPARRSALGVLVLSAIAVLTAACSHEPGPATEPPIARPEPLRSAAAASTAQGAEAPRPFYQIELAAAEGDLQPLLLDHAERAQKRGLKPFVQFFAEWCKPCKALAARMSDPALIEAFTGTYIIKLNFDDWQQKLADTGFAPFEIPMFYALDAQGKPTGRKLSGDAWGRANAESMARVLGPFFRR